MLQLEYGYTQFSDEDKAVLHSLASKQDGLVIVEVGCWVGNSTSVLAKIAKARKTHCCVVDWFMGNEGTRLEQLAKVDDVRAIFLQNMIELGLDKNIILFEENSTAAARHFIDNTIDFLFLDANHTYTGLINDLIYWYPKVRVGGTISGHDFNGHKYEEKYSEIDCVNGVHHGVTKALKQFFGEDFQSSGKIWHHKKT